jgi:subtilisin family serine protease
MRSLIKIMALLLFAQMALAQNATINPQAVYILAQGGLFGISGPGKVTLANAGLTNMAIYSFLDSAGATGIEKIFPDYNPPETLYVNYEGDSVRLLNLSQYYRIEFADSIDWRDLDSSWTGTDSFQIIGQEEYIYPTIMTPNDPYWFRQWYLQSAEQYSVKADSAWCYTTGNPHVMVGIVDAGLDRNHPDLSGRQIYAYNVCESSEDISDDQDEIRPHPGNHGTPVTGIIAANGNNDTGVAGLNWKSPIYFAKIAKDNKIVTADLAKGIKAVAGSADIISCSIGSHPPEAAGTFNTFIRSPEAAVCYNAWRKDRIIIASKGNDDSDWFFLPSDLPTVFGVGASTSTGKKTWFSNFGSSVDVVAPGEFIYTIARDGQYTGFSGTSAAAPIVAGVASLVKSYKSDLDADEIEQILEMTAKDLGDSGKDYIFGYGLVQADNALKFVATNKFFRKSNTAVSITTASGSHEHWFYNNGGLPTGMYTAITHKVTAHFDYPEYNFQATPRILLRNRVSSSWSAANPNNEMPFMGVAQGSVTPTACDIYTYAYEIKNILQQTIGWYPCNDPPCDNPNIRVRITVAGVPILQPVSEFDIGNDSQEQAVEIGWFDNNDFEDGWIVRRKIYGTSGAWQIIDTLPASQGGYISLSDSNIVGGETYLYQIKPFGAGQDNVAWSPEASVTTRPNRPLTIATAVSNYAAPSPILISCASNWPHKLSSAEKVSSDDPEEEYAIDSANNCGPLMGNDITIRWSPDHNNKYPITKYLIRRCTPPSMMGISYDAGLDTCIRICPNPVRSSFDIYVYAISSQGDTSLPISRRACTGTVNSCPDTPQREMIEDKYDQDSIFGVLQNSPNPFNTRTQIKFGLGKNTHVRLAVLDILGRTVKIIIDCEMSKGPQSVYWDGTNESGMPVASGIYLYRLETKELTSVKKMILLK